MLRREDYKAIKRMNRQQMDEYLKKVYMRGYNAAMKKVASNAAVAKQDPTQKEEKTGGK